MTKRGVSSIIPSICDISGHIAPYILKGKSILSRIWAYEKPVNPNESEEITSHDKADILLAQFEESERSPDTGKHPRNGPGGGSEGGEVDDSNDNIGYYQYEVDPSEPNPNTSSDSTPDTDINSRKILI